MLERSEGKHRLPFGRILRFDAAGEEAVVIGQAKGAYSKPWWQLEDETWVREDLVTAVGDCANIPIVKPS